MLEQKLPAVCADRLEYLLYGGYVDNLLSQKEIHDILKSVRYKNGKWYFTNARLARKYAEVSLWLTEHVFGSVWNVLTYEWAAEALLRAVDIGYITLDDIHFSTDDIMWDRLNSCTDSVVARCMSDVKNYKDRFVMADENDYDQVVTAKFRGVDPYVKTRRGMVLLTAIDADYKVYYNRVKNLVTSKRYVKFNRAPEQVPD